MKIITYNIPILFFNVNKAVVIGFIVNYHASGGGL